MSNAMNRTGATTLAALIMIASSAAAFGMSGLRVLFAIVLLSVSASAESGSFTILHVFEGTDGAHPAGLVQGIDGDFYGTTTSGGKYGKGTIFKITTGGQLTTLHVFNGSDGVGGSGLLLGTDGGFYATTSVGDGSVIKITAAGKVTTLYAFACSGPASCARGIDPSYGLIQGADSNFYGTNFFEGKEGGGTIYKLTPSRNLTVLYSFCDTADCDSGLVPNWLIQGADGNFYGTTQDGPGFDAGTVFKVTPSGVLTTLGRFCGEFNSQPCSRGGQPSGLIQGADGNFYGTTYEPRTIFRVTSSGKLTTLNDFKTIQGGPLFGVIQGTDGDFYGTTAEVDVGTVYKMTSSGNLSALYRFCANQFCLDGSVPGPLVQGTDGNFYGVTYSGGGAKDDGVIFKLSTGLRPFVRTLPTVAEPDEAVTILGSNLTGATRVTFNGRAAQFKIVSASDIMTTVPVGATTGYVEVVTPRGTLKSNEKFLVR
jgi:uncharacterized repeat protein (TIGR03803 family)